MEIYTIFGIPPNPSRWPGKQPRPQRGISTAIDMAGVSLALQDPILVTPPKCVVVRFAAQLNEVS